MREERARRRGLAVDVDVDVDVASAPDLLEEALDRFSCSRRALMAVHGVDVRR